ncbi:MAG: leucine-rich repeat protein [Eubacterium sp.]
MSIVYNGKKASDMVVNGRHVREAWIDGKKVWPEEVVDWGDWFVVRYQDVYRVNLYLEIESETICTVDWGDGTIEQFAKLNSTENAISHAYTKNGNYLVKFKGAIKEARFYKILYADLDNPGILYPNLTEIVHIPTSFQPKYAGNLFAGLSSITTIPFFDMSQCTTAQSIFQGCLSLKEVPLLNTKYVKWWDRAFEYCKSLENLPELSLEHLESAQRMFSNCDFIRNVPVFPSSMINHQSGASYIFYNCRSLEEVVGSISVILEYNNPGDMDKTFYNCRKLRRLPDLYVNSIYSAEHCFENCFSLESVSINIYSMRWMRYAFKNCIGLKNVTINLHYVENPFNQIVRIEGLFENCTSLDTVKIKTFYGPDQKYYDGIYPNELGKINPLPAIGPFKNCTALEYNKIPEKMRWS